MHKRHSSQQSLQNEEKLVAGCPLNQNFGINAVFSAHNNELPLLIEMQFIRKLGRLQQIYHTIKNCVNIHMLRLLGSNCGCNCTHRNGFRGCGSPNEL